MTAVQVNHGLEVDPQLVTVERVAQVCFHLEPLERTRLHARIEHGMPRSAVRLGPIQRQVGVAQDAIWANAAGRVRGDADAGADEHFAAFHHDRQSQRLGDPLGDLDGLLLVDDVLEQHREFVATEARGGVAGAQACIDAVGHLDQQRVARGVAQAVVDYLEAVQVEEQHRHLPALSLRARQGVSEPIAQQGAIGQAGQRVGEGQATELALECLALGDVAAGGDDAFDRSTKVAPRSSSGVWPQTDCAAGLA